MDYQNSPIFDWLIGPVGGQWFYSRPPLWNNNWFKYYLHSQVNFKDEYEFSFSNLSPTKCNLVRQKDIFSPTKYVFSPSFLILYSSSLTCEHFWFTYLILVNNVMAGWRWFVEMNLLNWIIFCVLMIFLKLFSIITTILVV
jgi:hypothetical protein